MKKNRFFKNTMGYFAEIVIAKAATTQTNYETFVSSAANGDLWAFWAEGDKQPAVAAGDIADAANAGKKFFFAYKDANGNTKRTADLEAGKVKFDKTPYNAGTAQAGTITFGGTVSATQTVHVRILETTGTIAPYPSYEYSVPFTTDIATTVVALRDKINAEKIDKFVTATAATNVLTITSNDKTKTFKLLAYIETSATAETDASAIVINNTSVDPVYPIGTSADLAELFRYYYINQGAVEYSGNGQLNGSDFGWPDVALATTSQWGFLLVKEDREEKGVTRNYNNYAKVLIAIATGELNDAAALLEPGG